ncbi:MAG TPA: DUF2341 domain-containing protein [Haliangium sp.]|nr:DUF2341 domain-containing protein [Haliangium sp.]
MAALLLLAGIPGCKFDPGGLSPGGETRADSGPPVDGVPLPVDGRPATDSGAGTDSGVTMDSGTAIDASLPPRPDAAPDNQRRKQITIDAARVQAPAVPGSLADFPVLFSVVDPDIRARAAADGSDIYFTDALGVTRLVHEIEKWDPTTGALVAWVKIPSLSASLNTVLYVNYGGQAEPVTPANVWTSDFAAVWHLAQDPGPGTSRGIIDSTGGNDGTAHESMQSGDLVAGQIGNAIDFDGTDDEITFNNPITGSRSHTISAWVNQRSSSNDDAVVVLGTGVMNQARWLYSVRSGGDVAVGFYTNDRTSGTNIENDGWRLLHWTYDGTTSRLYVSGAQQGADFTAGSVDTRGNTGWIGNVSAAAFGSNLNLNGQIDEVRIATVARPVEWITTEFNNQSSPATFYTVGPESE